jgi:hypothetical protein
MTGVHQGAVRLRCDDPSSKLNWSKSERPRLRGLLSVAGVEIGRTIFLKMLRGRASFEPSPALDLSNLLLDLRPSGPCRRSIALAETFAAPAMSSLDEAGG